MALCSSIEYAGIPQQPFGIPKWIQEVNHSSICNTIIDMIDLLSMAVGRVYSIGSVQLKIGHCCRKRDIIIEVEGFRYPHLTLHRGTAERSPVIHVNTDVYKHHVMDLRLVDGIPVATLRTLRLHMQYGYFETFINIVIQCVYQVDIPQQSYGISKWIHEVNHSSICNTIIDMIDLLSMAAGRVYSIGSVQLKIGHCCRKRDIIIEVEGFRYPHLTLHRGTAERSPTIHVSTDVHKHHVMDIQIEGVDIPVATLRTPRQRMHYGYFETFINIVIQCVYQAVC